MALLLPLMTLLKSRFCLGKPFQQRWKISGSPTKPQVNCTWTRRFLCGKWGRTWFHWERLCIFIWDGLHFTAAWRWPPFVNADRKWLYRRLPFTGNSSHGAQNWRATLTVGLHSQWGNTHTDSEGTLTLTVGLHTHTGNTHTDGRPTLTVREHSHWR